MQDENLQSYNGKFNHVSFKVFVTGQAKRTIINTN